MQTQDIQNPEFERTRQILNLVPNEDGVLQCHELIQGKHFVYFPADATFTRKPVQRIHTETLHGGVSLTMAVIREKYWIPTLRKSVRTGCWGYKRFCALPVRAPPPGLLPKEHTDISGAFEVIGTDFAGPYLVQVKKQKRRESLYGNFLLQFVKGRTSGTSHEPRNYYVLAMSVTADCKTGTSECDLFGQ